MAHPVYLCPLLIPFSGTMSFLAANAWPVGLLNIFEHDRANRLTFEDRYRGPYDKLLNYCFGNDFTFCVGLYPQPEESREDDPLVIFVVFHTPSDSPVLFLEAKDDSWAQKAALRFRADCHMRDRYNFMLSECSLPRLWGISVLGTSMRAYCGDTKEFHVCPEYTQHPRDWSHVLPSACLKREWETDILSQEGLDKMKEIVADVLTQVDTIVK